MLTGVRGAAKGGAFVLEMLALLVVCAAVAGAAYLGTDVQLALLVLGAATVICALSARHPETAFLYALGAAPLLPLYLVAGVGLAGRHSLASWMLLAVCIPVLVVMWRRVGTLLPSATLIGVVLVCLAAVQAGFLWPLLISRFSLGVSVRTLLFTSAVWYLPAIVAVLVGMSRRWVERLVSVIVLVGALEGLIAILEAGAGAQLMPFVMARLPLSNLFISVGLGETMTGQMVRVGLPRVKATFHQAIDLGWFLGIVLIIVIGCWPVWGRGLQLPVKLLALACVAGGLLATVSGTPMLATTCGLLLLIVLLPGSRRWRTLLSGVILLGLVGVLAAGMPSLSTYREAVAAYFGANNYVAQHGGVKPNREYRLSTYGRVWPLIEESPVLGHGDMLQRTDVMSRTRDLASRYLAVLIEGGVVGLIAAFLPAAWAIVTALRVRHRTRDPRLLALCGVYVAVLVQCLLMNGVKNYGGINDTLFWVFVGLACASPAFLLPASRSRGKLPSFAVFYPKGDSAVTGRQ